MRVYYFCPLDLTYRSGQTIQVIQDYKNLALQGPDVFLFGTYSNADEWREIERDLEGSSVSLMISNGSPRWLRWRFLLSMLRDRQPKVVIGRNYNKTRSLVKLKPLLGKCRIYFERHEDAIPYLLKKQQHAARDRKRYQQLLRDIDGLILTNYSQEEIFRREFSYLPATVVLPNGVDPQQFACAQRGENYVITYTGQFTPWKNVDLLFEALAHLDNRYTLRIAGGKGDEASRRWVEERIQRHRLQGRVDYQGFVPRSRLIEQTLNGSSALLLPLGNNLESTHFTSPLKLFEYMATPIPVIAVDHPSVRLVTGDDSVYLSPNQAEHFATTIRLAIENPDAERNRRMNACAARHSHANRASRFDLFLSST